MVPCGERCLQKRYFIHKRSFLYQDVSSLETLLVLSLPLSISVKMKERHLGTRLKQIKTGSQHWSSCKRYAALISRVLHPVCENLLWAEALFVHALPRVIFLGLSDLH